MKLSPKILDNALQRLVIFSTRMYTYLAIDLQTQSTYVFLPVTSGAVKLRVKTTHDAYIALTNGPYESNLTTEIIIGKCNNTQSTISRNDDTVREYTPGILNANEFVSFWIRWHDSLVSFGLKGESALIKYLDPRPHPITHFAVRTGRSAYGRWQIEVSPIIFRSLPVKPIKTGQLRWVRKTIDEQLPQDALIGGYEDGEVLYIGRAMHRNSLIVGKYVRSRQCVVVGWGRHLTEYHTCEILCGYNASWLKTSGDVIPPHAFEGGYDHPGDPYFIGRARIENNLVLGKVHYSHKICYVPCENTEIDMTEYEVLVVPDQLPRAVVWRPELINSSQNLDHVEDDASEYSNDGDE